MTRRAHFNDPFMNSVRLILIDEVHIVREMGRGPVMEILVSRIKAFSSNIRFIAVSATIPNAADFALWIGKRENEPRVITDRGETGITDSAQLYTFSEAFRPCPLTKVGPQRTADILITHSSSLLLTVRVRISQSKKGPLCI
jgi:ATP-dependent DNA helicase HFM1/MER3